MVAAVTDEQKAFLQKLTTNQKLLEVARRAIEKELICWRDNRISEAFRNNGLVIKEKDGGHSSVIRFGPETALAIGLRAIAKYEVSRD